MKKTVILMILPLLLIAIHSINNPVVSDVSDALEPLIINSETSSYKLNHHLENNLAVQNTSDSDLSATQKNSLDHYHDLYIGDTFASAHFSHYWITRYFDFEILEITEYEGVYSSFVDYYTKEELISGGAKSNEDLSNRYRTTEGITIHYSRAVPSSIEGSIYQAFGLSYAKTTLENTMRSKSDFDTMYSHKYTFTSKTLKHSGYANELVLDEQVATFCPEGFAMSVGMVGKYYVIEVETREQEVFWWGTYEVSKTIDRFMISNENEMFITFVYTNQAEVGMKYYLG